MVYETSGATQPIAAEVAPVSETPPAISGTGLVGYALTATAGAWSGEGPLAYTYQWERCNEEGEACSAISGATASSYTLIESDATHTVRVLVTAGEEGGGSTKAASLPIAVSATTLLDVSAPSISGANQLDRALSADHGIWTGAGAIAYAYQWERCNEHGESCTTITGATESSYTPGEADVGDTVKVTVTATGTAGTDSVPSAATPVILSEPIAPENLVAPSIEGNLTVGETLTAQPGSWLSSESISYGYQWQRCDEEGEECADIEGATSSTYTLGEGDIGSTLQVVVTASNSLGSASATSDQSEVVGAAGPPEVTEGPVINGTAREGAVLFAGNGIWSGSRPLSYYYQWERCDSSGESCTAIESATKPNYTAISGDVGSTLRIKIVVTNSAGSASAVSAPAPVAPGTEGSTTQALEAAEATDPSILAPSTTAMLEEQTVKPSISNSEEVIASSSGLTSSTISKETPGEFAVNTSVGQLSFTPLESSANATTTPTIVNGAAAVFAETSQVTDTFVRPTPLGATTLLQMRTSQAPGSFSWEIGIGSDQELEELPDGSVAVVEPVYGPDLESELPSESFESPESEFAETPAGEGATAEAAENEFESSLEEESSLEKLPTAPTTTTPETTPKSGELHPQETEAQYNGATSSMKSAEEHTADTIMMVIQAPKVLDASGATVPASLSVVGNTVTMNVTPSGGTTWPATAELAVAAPSDQVSATKTSGAHYGFSDPHSATFGHKEEHGKFINNFDSHLKSSPLHVKRARLFLNWSASSSNKELTDWLKAVKVAGLQPFITLRECEPTPEEPTCPIKRAPKLSEYYLHAKALMKALIKGNSERPPVRLWGSWNEPDHNGNAFHSDPQGPITAAYLWGETQLAVEKAGCKHLCTVVAGEFAAYAGHHNYVNKYETTILQAERKHHFPVKVKPRVWGMHDYTDLVQVKGIKDGDKKVLGNYVNKEARGFVKHTKKLYRSPHVWLTEQGVLLQDGHKQTRLYNNAVLQRLAAQDFIHLGRASEHTEWVYYYLYHGPAKWIPKPGESESERKRHEEEHAHAFDSALLPGEGVTKEGDHPAENPRQVYCVLALGDNEGCPARASTKTPVPGTTKATTSALSLNVYPEGFSTDYWIEYGATTGYGKTTTVTAVGNIVGAQSETVSLSGLEPCTTYHYQAVAENEANEGTPSLGGDQTFTTGGCVTTATAVTAGFSHACALLLGGSLECWGSSDSGELGDGTFGGPEKCLEYGEYFCSRTPVPVGGITNTISVSAGSWQTCSLLSGGSVDCWGEGTEEDSSTPVGMGGIIDAIAVSSGFGHACALLSGGGIECWGYNSEGDLGNGTTSMSSTPVPVSGITNATAITAGFRHTCALLSGGSIECWGENEYGQLGDGTKTNSDVPVAVSGISDAIAVSAGAHHACAVLSGGGVDCWGYNGWGQLGDGEENTNSDTPVAVSGVTSATAVTAGGDHTCALLSGGGINCWGSDGFGQLGDETITSTSDVPVAVSGITNATAIAAGNEYTCALLSAGGIDCWGYNGHGELGSGTTENFSDVPVPVQGLG